MSTKYHRMASRLWPCVLAVLSVVVTGCVNDRDDHMYSHPYYRDYPDYRYRHPPHDYGRPVEHSPMPVIDCRRMPSACYQQQPRYMPPRDRDMPPMGPPHATDGYVGSSVPLSR